MRLLNVFAKRPPCKRRSDSQAYLRPSSAWVKFPPVVPSLTKQKRLAFPPGICYTAKTFTLVTTLGPIDLFAEVPGIGTFQEVKASSKRVYAFDRSLFTLDLRGLITAKRAMGRPKDLEALLELESLLDASDD